VYFLYNRKNYLLTNYSGYDPEISEEGFVVMGYDMDNFPPESFFTSCITSNFLIVNEKYIKL
jgi:hypothetical protein